MLSEENLCSPLLERIKQLQEKRQQYRLISTENLMDSPLPLDRGIDQPLNSEHFSKVNSEMPHSALIKTPVSHKYDEYTGMKGKCDKIFSTEFKNECATFNTQANTLSCRDGLNKQSVELGLNQSEKKPSAPFPYLKKGEGLARYKTRILKGFKKRDNKNALFQSQQPSRDVFPIELEKYQDDSTSKKLSAFEKLEALVDQDSFCSTSSKVVELLQDDSSSPLLQKRPVPSIPLTPILRDRKPLYEKRGTIQTVDEEESRKSHTGILRSQFPCLVSSDLKVKFLDPGVEILEYDDDQFEKETTSNDSDVIDVSDLENLALLGCKVNFVEDISNASPGQQFSPLFGSLEEAPTHQLQPKLENITSSNRELNKNILTKTSLSVDELKINSHKMLLLAKTNELSKEIGIFRNRNKTLEELIKQLNKEKEALTQKQEEYSKFIDNEKFKTKRNLKINYRNQHAKSDFSNALSKKLQNLSEKLLKLEIENINLKDKLVSLERREKEALKFGECEPNNKDCIQKRDRKLQLETKQGAARSVTHCSIPKTKSHIRSNRAIAQSYSNACVKPALQSSKEKQPQTTSFKSESCVSKDAESKENVSNLRALNETASSFQEVPVDARSHFIKNSGDLSQISSAENNSKMVLRSPLTEKRNYVYPECQISSSNVKVLPNLSQKICEVPSRILDIQPTPITCIDKSRLSDSSSVHHYPNGDKKTVFPDKTVIHYVKDHIIHTIFREDGTEEISFANGQREIYFKDGSHQLMFSDGSSKTVYRDGSEVCVCKDGTVIHQNQHGTKTVHFPNGQKEIYEEGRIRRVYPDGTMKVLNCDGSQETHYPNGHVRFKDKDGNILPAK